MSLKPASRLLRRNNTHLDLTRVAVAGEVLCSHEIMLDGYTGAKPGVDEKTRGGNVSAARRVRCMSRSR